MVPSRAEGHRARRHRTKIKGTARLKGAGRRQGQRSCPASQRQIHGPPSRLYVSALTVGPMPDRRAEVTAEVSATWLRTGGRVGSYASEAFTWRFETREDNGWQVSAVKPPEWCGGYVRLDACNR